MAFQLENYLKSDEVGGLAPIATVMLPEALALEA